jgi:3-hydroxyisobutyrate dehydrogenase-like beta-hydroxyacid dehydrogenase
MNVAFIGLGVMGFPMAGHLAVKGGHRVVVYNRTAARAAEWVKRFNGTSAATPAEAAKGAEVVFTCVGNDDDLRSVTLGPQGCVQALEPGSVLVDHTTASAAIALELDRACQAKGCHFMDAPVSGGQAGAENGALSVMCGAEANTFEKVQGVLSGSYAAKLGLMGAVGSGQLAKMVNQICIAGVVQGLAEGLHFADKAGLDIDKLVDVISQGAAGSWQMRNRWQTMKDGEYDFGFAVNWMRKDLGMALDEATRNGASLPVTALVNQFYREVQSMGGGRWDTSSLLARLER